MSKLDLEQEIFNCWRFKDDLEIIYHKSEGATEDEIMNALLGTMQMMEWRFEILMEAYRQSLQERNSNG